MCGTILLRGDVMSYVKNGNTYLTTKELKEYHQEQKKQKIKRMARTNAVLWESLKIAIGVSNPTPKGGGLK